MTRLSDVHVATERMNRAFGRDVKACGLDGACAAWTVFASVFSLDLHVVMMFYASASIAFGGSCFVLFHGTYLADARENVRAVSDARAPVPDRHSLGARRTIVGSVSRRLRNLPKQTNEIDVSRPRQDGLARSILVRISRRLRHVNSRRGVLGASRRADSTRDQQKLANAGVCSAYIYKATLRRHSRQRTFAISASCTYTPSDTRSPRFYNHSPWCPPRGRPFPARSRSRTYI